MSVVVLLFVACGGGVGDGTPRQAPECEEVLTAVRAQVASVRRDLEGEPQPFGVFQGAEVRPDAVRSQLTTITTTCPGLEVGRVDCDEFPCLVWVSGLDADCRAFRAIGDGRVPWQHLWEWRATEVASDGAERLWQVFARVSLGDKVAESVIADPHAPRRLRVGWRVRRGHHALGLGPDPTVEEAPAPRAGARCEAKVAHAQSVLSAGRVRAYGSPVQPTHDLDRSFAPKHITGWVREATRACPTLAAHLIQSDCSEFPCISLWSPNRDAVQLAMRDCPPWSNVPTDRSVSMSETLVDPAGAYVQLVAFIHLPPSWFTPRSGLVASQRRRLEHRTEQLMRTAMAEQDLRPPTELDWARNQLAATQETAALAAPRSKAPHQARAAELKTLIADLEALAASRAGR